jgi:septum formation protein
LKLPPLILASASPRRRELLQAAGIDCVSVPAETEELTDDSLGLPALVLANARAKALEVAVNHPDRLVIGADTLVWLDGQSLGKPRDLPDARNMLAKLSGRTHQVATGVHLLRWNPQQQLEFHEVTCVRFRQLDDILINDYLSRVDVLDKAGAYALQEHGDLLIETVEGCRNNVIGLPVTRLKSALQRFIAAV